MKAVILVGGEATRLRPLTCNTPKAMVPVLNRPFLEHILHRLHSHGVDTVVLALGHMYQSIADYFGDGQRLGLKLIYSVEDQPLGTAGPVRLAQQYLDDRFLVLNGDVFSDFDITSLVEFHARNGARATITLTPVENPTIYGVVETEPNGRVKRFVEKPRWEEVTTNLINAGVYVLETNVLDLIPGQARVMFEHDVFPLLLKRGEPVFGYRLQGYWIDIGTPEKYLQLNLDLLLRGTGRPQQQAGTDIGRGQRTRVHPTARIVGPVLLGDGCEVGVDAQIDGPATLGAGCHIGAGAQVRSSVLWNGVRVGKDSRIIDSVVGNGCVLGAGACVEGHCAVGDGVTIAEGTRLEPGSRVWPGTCEEG
ncbi:MAG: NDP-sugar synthase [Chloroflexota bacterium]